MLGPQEALYREHFRSVWKFLHRCGARGADLQDLVQETFVVAFRKLPTFDSSRPAGLWLRGIAWRVLADHRRVAYHQREEPIDETEELVSTVSDPETLASDAETKLLVMEALDSLKLPQRAALVLSELEGYSIPEVAEVLDCPVPTAHSRLRMARAAFARAVWQIQLRRTLR